MTDQAPSKWESRKYQAAWKLTWLFTALHVIPALTSFIMNAIGISTEFSLLPVEWYCGTVSLLWTWYFGANLAQKTTLFGGVPKEELPVPTQPTVGCNETEEDLSGGQPTE